MLHKLTAKTGINLMTLYFMLAWKSLLKCNTKCSNFFHFGIRMIAILRSFSWFVCFVQSYLKLGPHMISMASLHGIICGTLT